jgi:hypothetical protein
MIFCTSRIMTKYILLSLVIVLSILALTEAWHSSSYCGSSGSSCQSSSDCCSGKYCKTSYGSHHGYCSTSYVYRPVSNSYGNRYRGHHGQRHRGNGHRGHGHGYSYNRPSYVTSSNVYSGNRLDNHHNTHHYA